VFTMSKFFYNLLLLVLFFLGNLYGQETDSQNTPPKTNAENESGSGSIVVKPKREYEVKRTNFKKYVIRTKSVRLGSIDEDNKGKRYAISVGINNYNDSGINDLSKARNDAKILGKVLQTNGQFNPIYIMTDDIDPRKDKNRLYPTKSNIEQRLDSVLENIRSQDMLVFFFSGHGVSDYNENGYILYLLFYESRFF
jgi:hypothetical protein